MLTPLQSKASCIYSFPSPLSQPSPLVLLFITEVELENLLYHDFTSNQDDKTPQKWLADRLNKNTV